MDLRAIGKYICTAGAAALVLVVFSGYPAAADDIVPTAGEPLESCIYNLSPKSKSFPAGAGSVTVTVTAPGKLTCPVPVVSNGFDWITATAVQNWKNNRGTVKVSVPANQSYHSRAGSLLVGDKPFPVVQAGMPCKNVVTFSETYDERLECMVEEGETYCDVMGSGTFAITGRVVLAGVDVRKFGKDTEVSFDMGEFLFSTTLGDDPRYRPGRTSARFTFADYDFFDRLTTYLTVTIAWTASQMTITINGSTPEFLSPVVAGDFVGSETGSVETSVPVTITIDSDEMFVAEGEAVIRGQVATSTVVRGWDEFEISTVDVSGKATLCQ